MSLNIISLVSAIIAAANPPPSKHRRNGFNNGFAFLNPRNQSFTYMHQNNKGPDVHSRADYMGHITSKMRRAR